MGDPSRVRVAGPLKPFAGGFGAELARLGYTASSTSLQLGVLAHASRWLEGQGIAVGALTPEVAAAFVAARRAAGYTQYLSVKALAPLLCYLRGLGAAPPIPPVAAAGAVEALLVGYHAWLVGQRGVTAATARGYADAVRPFLARHLGTEGALDLHRLDAGDVTRFVVARCPQQPPGSAKVTVTELRSLLTFLHLEGVVAVGLASAVPSVARPRLAGLPRALPADQVTLVLASCDTGSAAGRRDLAVLTLLARLGLRAGEVAALQLGDVDWRRGELLVRGKGDRHERMPLPVDVGDAVVAYLRDGRPTTGLSRSVFLRVRAPHHGMTTAAVSNIVFAAGRRAGLAEPVRAHRLRHSAATGLLRAGASLGEVGQVLRHSSPLTTAIYAKVDSGALRTLARPWPGGAS